MSKESSPHSELPTLPTVAECDERIIEAQYVVERPDEYDVEVRVQAAKDASRWTFNRRFALALESAQEQLEAALRVAEAAKTYRDVRGDYSWVQMIQALDAWEHPNPTKEPS